MNEQLTPFQQLQQAGVVSGPRPRGKFPPDVAKARAAERLRRNVEAQRRARMVLQVRYADEYENLLAAEKAGLEAEKGPLPGDES